jgi:hypothetical protein
MDESIPCGFIRKTKYPSWFSAPVRYYIHKKIIIIKDLKRKTLATFYNQFSKYHKLVKTTIKSDRLAWLKSIDDNLKRQPAKFWKFVSTFQKSNSTLIQLHGDGTCTNDPGDVAEAFVKHFYTSYSCISPPLSSISAYCYDFLSLAPISDLNIQKAIQTLRPTKSVGLDHIPGFIIKGCSDILEPVLKYIVNLSLPEKHSPCNGSNP